MQYQIITASSTAGMEEQVRALLAEGWEPLGILSVFVHDGGGGAFLVREMIKEEE